MYGGQLSVQVKLDKDYFQCVECYSDAKVWSEGFELRPGETVSPRDEVRWSCTSDECTAKGAHEFEIDFRSTTTIEEEA